MPRRQQPLSRGAVSAGIDSGVEWRRAADRLQQISGPGRGSLKSGPDHALQRPLHRRPPAPMPKKPWIIPGNSLYSTGAPQGIGVALTVIVQPVAFRDNDDRRHHSGKLGGADREARQSLASSQWANIRWHFPREDRTTADDCARLLLRTGLYSASTRSRGVVPCHCLLRLWRLGRFERQDAQRPRVQSVSNGGGFKELADAGLATEPG